MTTGTHVSRFEQWEDESGEQEYILVEDYLNRLAMEWGNSYVAMSKTAVAYGVPHQVVIDAVQHYTEVVYRGEV